MVRNYRRKTARAGYPKHNLFKALAAIRNHEMSQTEAAKRYGIPVSTLNNRLKGRRGAKSSNLGRDTAIPWNIEAKLAAHIKTMEKWGFGLSKQEILLAIGQYIKDSGLKTPFKNFVVGNDFFRGFMRRHRLSQKKPQAVEIARKRNVDPFVIAEYFKMVKEITTGIPPHRIYNLDETSFCLDPSRVKVVGEKGTAAHRVTAGPGRENFSVLLGGNAAGDKLPPLIIFKGKNVWDSWTAKSSDEFPGMSYAATQNGWMETTTFENYFDRVFLKAIPKARPVVLIYDGHSSHTSLKLIEKALKEQVIILKLPPHTSHLLQPMDLAVFKPLKLSYDKAVIAWQRKNYGVKMPKSVFSAIISRVWNDMDRTILESGFGKSGIYPFCDNVIPSEKYDVGAWRRFQKAQSVNKLSNDENEVPSEIGHTPAQENIPSASVLDSSSESSFHGFDNTEGSSSKAYPPKPLSLVNKDPPTKRKPGKSFEEILLEHVKQQPSTRGQKRRKICAGVEVITSSEVLERLRKKDAEEQSKAAKKGKRAQKPNNSPRV